MPLLPTPYLPYNPCNFSPSFNPVYYNRIKLDQIYPVQQVGKENMNEKFCTSFSHVNIIFGYQMG